MTREEATRILDFWEAYDRIIPLQHPWMQTAEICMCLDRIVSALHASAGVKYEMRDIGQFMPPQWVAPDPGKRILTATSSK